MGHLKMFMVHHELCKLKMIIRYLKVLGIYMDREYKAKTLKKPFFAFLWAPQIVPL